MSDDDQPAEPETPPKPTRLKTLLGVVFGPPQIPDVETDDESDAA